jgi:hypothetical protein
LSSQNQVSVCNISLLSIGARAQVSSITPSDGSEAADACSTLFAFVFEQLARTARWGCLKKQVTATLIQAAQGTPENPNGTTLPLPQQFWQYGYLYPEDCLLMRQVLPPINSQPGSGTPQLAIANSVAPWVAGQVDVPYEIAYSTNANGDPVKVILTNQENAVINYNVNQQNPATWDSLFTSAYCASLAAFLVPALALNMQLMSMQVKLANSVISVARGQDGNESPQSQDHIPDWMNARQGATGYLKYYGLGYEAYGMMAWPGPQ